MGFERVAGQAFADGPHMSEGPEVSTRKIGLILMIAIYAAPVVFWWLLLRRGYANSTRVAAFTYALVSFVAIVAIVTSSTYPK